MTKGIKIVKSHFFRKSQKAMVGRQATFTGAAQTLTVLGTVVLVKVATIMVEILVNVVTILTTDWTLTARETFTMVNVAITLLVATVARRTATELIL